MLVADPSIEQVLDISAGTFYPAAWYLDRPEQEVFLTRTKLKEAEKRNEEWLVCAICRVPVYVSGTPEGKVFFKHRHERADCPWKTGGTGLDHDAIEAIKYNGAKESHLHRLLKEFIKQCLDTDPRFTDVQVEVTYRSTGIDKSWRRPDVQAKFNGKPVVFEIQLSTTFLDVIIERKLFYQREGASLIWIFAKFDVEDQRFTEKDVFYNNNLNVFVVNERTVDQSTAGGGFILQCHWRQPAMIEQAVKFVHEQADVGFGDLTFDIENQRVFYFDFDAALIEAERCLLVTQRDAGVQRLRDDIQAYWCTRSAGAFTWPGDMRTRMHSYGHELPEFIWQDRSLEGVLNAAYSAKLGRVIGWRHDTLVQVAHNVFDHYKPYVPIFFQMIAAFDRTGQLKALDASGKLAAKVGHWRMEGKMKPEYLRDRQYDSLLEFLIPELNTLRTGQTSIGNSGQ